MEPVRALVLDSAVLFGADELGSVQLLPDAARFLQRLHYSNMFIGVVSIDVSRQSLSQKEALLGDIGVLNIEVVSLNPSLSARMALRNLESLWSVSSASCIYVTTRPNDLVEGGVFCPECTVLHFTSSDTGNKDSGNRFGPAATIQQLHEIPAFLANLNKKRALGVSLVVVGYIMKWSRELDFLKRRAFPVVPTQGGLSFMPINLEQPLGPQLNAVDVILQKATDEIQTGIAGSVQFSTGMQELQRYLRDHPRICVVDPLNQVLPLLDRVATQAILQSLRFPAKEIIRSPRSVEVTTFDEPWLSQALESQNVVLPAIVKPQIACGASEAHTMGVVFRKEGFEGLPVPLPAEYIDHGAFQYKMYVLGSRLLYSCRRSTPNAAALAYANKDASSVVFDSLKSLPVIDDVSHGVQVSNYDEGSEELNLKAVEAAADLLRKKLGLTIMGFDLVIQAGTNDYVIVDVNYFPSFKDIPDTEAIPAFWEALLTAVKSHLCTYIAS